MERGGLRPVAEFARASEGGVEGCKGDAAAGLLMGPGSNPALKVWTFDSLAAPPTGKHEARAGAAAAALTTDGSALPSEAIAPSELQQEGEEDPDAECRRQALSIRQRRLSEVRVAEVQRLQQASAVMDEAARLVRAARQRKGAAGLGS